MEPSQDQLATPSEPTPALPLNYFEQHREPWLPVTRMVVWLVLATQAYYLIDYVIGIGVYMTHTMSPRFRNPAVNGPWLLFHIPYAIKDLILLIGALDARKLLEVGRRWIVCGAMLELVIAVPIGVIEGIYYHIENRHWFYGSTYAVFMFLSYFASGVGALIFPLFLWKFFRRSEVRELFGFTSH